ncbi:MAG: HDIG domain-containing protein [Chloroflexi bacterium]|nr:HDIG domain-containing protein [Chloroflexota bacterium]
MPHREAAWDLLTQHTKSESLRRHCLGVEAALRAYARYFEEDEELWGVTGLLHDFDYEEHPTPDEHPLWGCRLLEVLGYPEEVIHAIKGHAEYLGVPRISPLDKALFACDELVGFLMAVAYVRPTKNLIGVEPSSVRKKMKDKAFARAVSREDIIQGAVELGVDLDEHIGTVRAALQDQAAALGLQPASASSAELGR